MRSLLGYLPVGPCFIGLSPIFPVAICSWVSFRGDHFRTGKEEECFVGDFAAGSPRLLLCILEHIYILGDPLYFELVALHFIMQIQTI